MKKKLHKSGRMRLFVVVGARPNFVKIAPLFWELKKHPGIEPILVHTGQHYDFQMSQIFFRDLDIPRPDYNLGIGSGNHGEQTGRAMIELEKVMALEKPDMVVVVGDVNSTLAGALVAAKLHIPAAHIEAGLRSYDKSMPEEINRIVADHVSRLLFCPTETAVGNLKKEGVTAGVFNTGDIMLDILREKLGNRESATLEGLHLKPKGYSLLTLHRPSNVENNQNLEQILQAAFGMKENIIFPVHPRTEIRIKKLGLAARIRSVGNIRIISPVSYLEMLLLEKNARNVLTDSGGVQKEAYWLGIPCITLREQTEWTETLRGGWNVLAGADKDVIIKAVRRPFPAVPPRECYGDGHAAKKMVDIINRGGNGPN